MTKGKPIFRIKKRDFVDKKKFTSHIYEGMR